MHVLIKAGTGRATPRGRVPGDVLRRLTPGRVVGLLGPAEATAPVLRTLARAGAPHGVGLVRRGALYRRLSVEEHLRMGAGLNPGWDDRHARLWVGRSGLDPGQKAGRLTRGQRASLALILASAKQPGLLVFDDPATGLDPVARRVFLREAVELVAEAPEPTCVIFRSPSTYDVKRVCDDLVVLSGHGVELAGPIDELIAEHFRLIARRAELLGLPAGIEVIQAEQAIGWVRLTVRRSRVPIPRLTGPVRNTTLEELVIAYLARQSARQSAEGRVGLDQDRPWDGFDRRYTVS